MPTGNPAGSNILMGQQKKSSTIVRARKKKIVDRLGTETRFSYDYQRRKIKEEKRSKKGEVLSTRHWVYNAFHLLYEVDPEGIVTTYAYDGAGRLISERRGTKEILYTYDSLGRQKEKWELCGPGEYRITTVEYDVLDQIIEERVESGTKDLFLRKLYAYDSRGHRKVEILCTSSGPSRTRTTYYSEQKIVPFKII